MNRLLTIDEAVELLTDDVKKAAADLGVDEHAVALVFGAMLGAPIADESMKWAADEISKSSKEKA